MLPTDYLVPPGDWLGMSAKVIDLLNNGDRLAKARYWAKERSQQFRWESIAHTTSELYIKHWQLKTTVQADVSKQPVRSTIGHFS
jgi:glycosyltransferase involved in cell wall biosynthesis